MTRDRKPESVAGYDAQTDAVVQRFISGEIEKPRRKAVKRRVGEKAKSGRGISPNAAKVSIAGDEVLRPPGRTLGRLPRSGAPSAPKKGKR